MLAFQIALNGKGLVTAGLPGPGVLSAIVSSVRRAPKDTPPEGARSVKQELEQQVEQELKLSVGSLATLVREHIDWANVDLKLGDEIVVRVVEVADAAPPQPRRGGRAAAIEAAVSRAAATKAAATKAASGTKGKAPGEAAKKARKKAAPAGKKRKTARLTRSRSSGQK